MRRPSFLPVFLATILLLASIPVFSQEYAVSTNVLDYASGGTLNLSASWGVARHISLELAGKYNPFSFGSGPSEWYARQRAVSLGCRWWPWYHYSGWWLGGAARWQEYARVRRGETASSEGDRIGVNITAGYALMLGRHFNIDFGLGGWLGYSTLTRYACQHCGRIEQKSEGFFLLPSDFIMSVVYIF